MRISDLCCLMTQQRAGFVLAVRTEIPREKSPGGSPVTLEPGTRPCSPAAATACAMGPAPGSNAEPVSQLAHRQGGGEGTWVPGSLRAHFLFQQENLWRGLEARRGHERRPSCAFMSPPDSPESCGHKAEGRSREASE